jgi:YegS/Rv2252/BmrU family lipid kinase
VPTPPRVTVIVNPVSGRRSGRRPVAACVDLARSVLDAEGCAGEIHVTRHPGHAVELAQAATARDATLVVAWGGDGTVNEAGRALAFGPVPLGIIPAGSGNGLARTLGLPADPAAALRTALRGAERTLDVGELGGRLFLNLAGIGLDAEVAARFNARSDHRRGGGLAYVALTARALLTYRAPRCEIRLPDARWQTRALLIVCANGREYGGGATIAPQAIPDDGWLDLVVVEARSPLAALWSARRLFTGGVLGAPGVRTWRVQAVEVSGEAPLRFHVDGEPVTGEATLGARIHSRALRVRVGPLRPSPGSSRA